jgi:hypothetical protein
MLTHHQKSPPNKQLQLPAQEARPYASASRPITSNFGYSQPVISITPDDAMALSIELQKAAIDARASEAALPITVEA